MNSTSILHTTLAQKLFDLDVQQNLDKNGDLVDSEYTVHVMYFYKGKRQNISHGVYNDNT